MGLTGIEKAAVLMNVIGKEKAGVFLRSMGDDELKEVIKVMGSMKKAPVALVNEVLREFLGKISEREELIFDDNEIAPEAMGSVLGEERAKALFGVIAAEKEVVPEKLLAILDTVDARTLARYLTDEHPQTIALVLAHMNADKQIQMLRLFPEVVRPEIVIRMATLDYVSPDKVHELDEVLKTELKTEDKSKETKLGGVPQVADMINSLDAKSMNALMGRLEERDPILAEELRQKMFTFADMEKIDERFIQIILREVSGQRLLLALKGASNEIREKVYRSMSSRASEMLRDDLQALGPQKAADVEGAQREIVKIVKRLSEEGKIVIGVSENSDMV